MTAYECFQKSERIEALAQEIYARLASDFAEDAVAAAEFRKLADEEAQHAQRIQLLGRTHRGKSIFDGAASLEQRLEAGLRLAEQLLAEVTAGAWGRDLRRVTERMVDMEEQLAGFHAEAMAHAAEPSVQKLFQALAQQDRQHRALIEKIGRRGQ